MKNKSMQSDILQNKNETITEDMLSLINKYSRRALSCEEVYVFSLILCDNEVDRDFEKFSIPALEKMSELFLGVSGIFDHAPKAANQSARIFDTSVECDEDIITSDGEVYHTLKAYAYMVVCESNKDLILEIDAGIKKEVSVGINLDEIRCSICDKDIKNDACEHIKGEYYEGGLCYYILNNPIDAYEWSFVAVPAQKNAGVTKKHTASAANNNNIPDKNSYNTLTRLAQIGNAYLCEIKKDFVKYACLSTDNFVNSNVLEKLCEKLNLEEINTLKSIFHKNAEKKIPLPQLCNIDTQEEDKNRDYII